MTDTTQLRTEEQEIISHLKRGKQVYADSHLYEFRLASNGELMIHSGSYIVGAYWMDYTGKNFDEFIVMEINF